MAGYLSSALALLIATPIAYAEKSNAPTTRQAVACQQVFFTDHQLKSLAQDRPLRDLVLSNEHLFVLGQEHVWRFDLGKSALRKFRFAPATALQSAHLARDSNTGEVYLATPKMLFAMRSAEPKVKKYFQQTLTDVFDFSVAPKNYIWITAKGIYLLERQSLQLRYIRYPFKPTDRVVIAPALSSFFVLRGDRLLRVDQGLRGKEILRTAGLQVGADGQAIYVQRDEALLRYTFAGELLQTIPVLASRRLVGMHFASNWHSYMFSDDMFEHYQLSDKKVLVGKCIGGAVAVGNELDVFAGRLAFISSDNPYMYELRK